MPILRLPEDLWERCVSIARAALPNEACGLVSGHLDGMDGSGGRYTVTGIHPVANSLRSPTAFALDGRGMISAEQAIDAAGVGLLGVFHSHPTSQAFPSARDLADAAIYDPTSAFAHIIVSMQGFTPTIRAFRYGGSDGAAPSEYALVGGLGRRIVGHGPPPDRRVRQWLRWPHGGQSADRLASRRTAHLRR